MYKQKSYIVKSYIVHTKYVLMIGKHQESSYYDEARLTTSKYYFI